MDEQKEKQNAKKKRSALPIYAIGIVCQKPIHLLH